ncbi:MAG: ATP-binding cassette domain-containing protein [Armatimonadetes bacterium]|nr:ATP-binding cassette domain-containing protein [Armatimonadota bacterium]
MTPRARVRCATLVRMVAVGMRGLTVAYHGVPVFEDLSLEIEKGAFVCVMGPNAVGKSSLLRVLAGLQTAQSGEVTCTSSSRLMFQETDLFPWLTIRENLAIAQPASIYGPDEYWRLAFQYLKEVGLEGRLDTYPHELSGGGRQRAAIVRCFLSGAEVLLLDEPFSHLDPNSRLHLQNVILQLWRETGRTIVLVTHDLHEAVTLGDQVVVMQDVRNTVVVPVARAERNVWTAGEGPTRDILAALHAAPPPSPAETPRRRPRALSLAFVASPLLALGLWELASTHGWLDARFFPPPSKVLATVGSLAASGALTADVKASLLRLVLGLLLGGGLGLACGVLMARYPRLRAIAEPLVAITYPLPKIAILPLLLVIFDIGEVSKVVTLAIGAFFLVLLPTMQGVEDVQQRYGDTIRSLRLGGFNLYWRALFLGALSSILTGFRTAAGYCLVLLVAAEFTGTSQGVGRLVWHSWELFDIEAMYAGLLILALAGFLLFFGTNELSRRIPWRRGENA